jgi:pyrimidine oxygenase
LPDDYAMVPAVRGVMLTSDDLVEGMDKFGERIQPLIASRRHGLGQA